MNGTMRYLRRVTLGNNEHKEFSAEISYSTVDDDDYLTQKGVIDRAADLAVQIAEERLGLRPTKDDNVAAVKVALKAAMNAPITKEEVEKASKPALHLVETFDEVRTPATPELVEAIKADHAEMAQQLKETAHQTAIRHVAEQPAAVDLPDDDGVVVTVAEPAPEAFDVAAPVEPEITYDDLYNMANGWVTGTDAPGARTRRTTAFQKLMRKYATQLSAIPQDRRPAFVAEFTELQAATK